MIVVDHVFKSVAAAGGSLEILHGIDFSLSAGSTTAIVGASGSGKSTLLSVMAGLDVGRVQPLTYLHWTKMRERPCAAVRWDSSSRIFSFCRI